MGIDAVQGKRLVHCFTAAVVAVGVTLAVTAAAAFGLTHTKKCAHVSGCTSVLSTPPRPTFLPPGGVAPPPAPLSHFGITVQRAPTAVSGAPPTPGTLIEKVDAGTGIKCPGYTPRDNSTFVFKLLTPTPTQITYEIVDRITNTTADGIQFCLAANFAFKTASGDPAPAAQMPDGTMGHLGLLPHCLHPTLPAGVATAPCIEHIGTVPDSSSNTGVDVVLRVRVPAQTSGDPWGGS
jgi:hypothetical protein